MILYGKQIFFYFLEHKKESIQKVYLSKEIEKSIFKKLYDLEIVRVDTKKAQALAKGGNHQGFIFEIDEPPLHDIGELKSFSKILVLVGLSDVGNIGAIVRSAYSLGCDGVVISECSSFKLDGVIRSSSGIAIDMPISLYKSSKDLINELKQVGFLQIGLDKSGEDLRDKNFKSLKKIAIFVGSEGFGMPKKILEKLDSVVSIKMEREFDSLNVSVATGILLDRIRDE